MGNGASLSVGSLLAVQLSGPERRGRSLAVVVWSATIGAIRAIAGFSGLVMSSVGFQCLNLPAAVVSAAVRESSVSAPV